MNAKVFFFFFFVSCLSSHIYTLKKKTLMSSPVTPFQAAQQRSALSLGSLYNTHEASHLSAFPLEDISPSSTSFTSGLGTPPDQSLLPPLGISSPMSGTLSTSLGPVGNENAAYSQVMRQYYMVQNELIRGKQEHNVLKYVQYHHLYLLTLTRSRRVIHRTIHNKLVDSHNLLMTTYIESKKRSHAEGLPPCAATQGSAALYDLHMKEEADATPVPSLSRSNYPAVNYWTKDEWTRGQEEASKEETEDPVPDPSSI